MTKFICIGGRAQHGKDTTAKMFYDCLVEQGYKAIIVHYADLLKFICRNYMGWNGEKDEAGRTLLQYVGTEVVREKRPNFWVDFVVDVISLLDDKIDFVIVPDTRFPNEIDRVRERGYPAAYIKVIRSAFDNRLTDAQKKHPSETALDYTKPDHVLVNITLPQLKNDVEKLAKVLKDDLPIGDSRQMTIFEATED